MLEMTITFPGGKKIDADAGSFTVKTDQPKDEGGDGTAPSPFALFLASIGTCAGFYIQSFCESRDVPIDGLKIVQKHEWSKEQKRVTDVTLEVHLPAGFPEKYRDAVLRAANQCTVKRALADPPNFEMKTIAG